jgi:Ca2+-binding EF-hand superfamily protein
MTAVAEDIGLERPSKEEVDEIVKGLDSSGNGRLCMYSFRSYSGRISEC